MLVLWQANVGGALDFYVLRTRSQDTALSLDPRFCSVVLNQGRWVKVGCEGDFAPH